MLKVIAALTALTAVAMTTVPANAFGPRDLPIQDTAPGFGPRDLPQQDTAPGFGPAELPPVDGPGL